MQPGGGGRENCGNYRQLTPAGAVFINMETSPLIQLRGRRCN
jgi:hypothetical protein